MERRGEERSRGEGGLAAVGVWERVRERPRSGDGEAIQRASGGKYTKSTSLFKPLPKDIDADGSRGPKETKFEIWYS